MVKITITGDTPSKKNNRQAIYVKGRTIFIANKLHQAWHKQALPQLLGTKPVDNVKSVSLKFFPSTKRLWDLSNKAESIMDLLVDASIIEDDNYSVIPKLILEIGGKDKENPRCEIIINYAPAIQVRRPAGFDLTRQP